MPLTKMAWELSQDGSSARLVSSDGVSPITLLEFDDTGKCIGGNIDFPVLAGAFNDRTALGSENSMELPNGWLLKIGTAAGSGNNTSTSVLFAESFPTEVFGVWPAAQMAGVDVSDLIPTIGGVTISGFTINHNTSSTIAPVVWFALGR